MAQTFYIEADEEIISIVGRLRHATETEVILVVPKRAILSQSVVSLKLLERESRKIGKHVIVISQDNNARALAEKAGLETRPYQEEMERREKLAAQHAPLPSASVSVENLVSDTAFPAQFSPDPKSFYAVKAENIGSDDFYQTQGENISNTPTLSSEIQPILPVTPPAPAPLQIRIRDNSPKNLTALNSKIEESIPEETVSQKQSFAPPIEEKREVIAQQISSPKTSLFAPRVEQNTLLQAKPPVERIPLKREILPVEKKPSIPISRSTRYALVGFSAAFIVLVGGFSLFLFQSKATISLLPYSEQEEAQFELKLTQRNSPEAMDPIFSIPLDIIEENIEVSLPVEATGVASKEKGSDRARGKIIIYNNYNQEPQTLVSTTRFESSNGKIFRLTQGVTVPGMTEIGGKKEPGAIEASVVADQPGSDYNISSTTFTIPGFKGGPKFEKFEAKSTGVMSGGGNGEVSGATLTLTDIEKARSTGKEKAIESLKSVLAEKTDSESRISDESIELTLISEEPGLIEGMAADNISVRFKYATKTFVVSDKEIRETLDRSIRKNQTVSKTAGVTLLPSSITMNTVKVIPDFKNASGKAMVSADVVLSATINTDAVATDLMGMHIDNLGEIIKKYPEIEKINLSLSPEYFVKTLPSSKDRMSITLLNPESK